MKKEKARLIEISDTIVKIDDITASKLGNTLKESYWKSNYLNKNDIPLKIKLKKEKKLQLQRERINKNNHILEKLRYNIDFQRRQEQRMKELQRRENQRPAGSA